MTPNGSLRGEATRKPNSCNTSVYSNRTAVTGTIVNTVVSTSEALMRTLIVILYQPSCAIVYWTYSRKCGARGECCKMMAPARIARQDKVSPSADDERFAEGHTTLAFAFMVLVMVNMKLYFKKFHLVCVGAERDRFPIED